MELNRSTIKILLFCFVCFIVNQAAAQRLSTDEGPKIGSRISARSKVNYRPVLVGSNPECEFSCKSSARRPQCGSNGRTYLTKCQARKAKCLDPMLTTKPGKCKGSICFKARDHYLRKMQSLSASDSVYIPNCTVDGLYAPRQCNDKVGFCWCVTSDGKMVAGSAVQHVKPICTTGNVRRSTGSCSSNKRSVLPDSVRRKALSEYRKATPTAEVPASIDDTLRLALSWRFSTIDSDKNLKLDKRELRLLLKSANARECASEFTALCDQDKNKEISRDEWTDCLFVAMSSNSPKQIPSRSSTSTTAILTDYSTVGPVSNSRCLQEDQLSLVNHIRKAIVKEYKPSGSSASTTPDERENAAILWKFSQLDRNSNQEVNYKETRRIRRKIKKATFKECFMNICDKDKNKIISQTEWDTCFRLNRPKPCHEERQKALQRSSTNENVYVPECEAENPRYFSQVQCHVSGFCWCTLPETGRLIPGTSTRNDRPNCNKSAKPTKPSSLSIPGCKEPSVFIASLQNALVRKKSQELGEDTGESFSSQVAIWFYERIDANHDQKLSRKESKLVRKLFRRKVSPKRCLRKFMRFCDGDSNKKVSQPEFLECLQVSSG